MSGPYVTIDLEKIAHNARTITRLCGRYGIAVTGVTKGTCGLPAVAQAMLRGGVTSIGESRMPNIHRLKASGVHTSYMLLRLPPLSEVDEVVTGVDISLNSELTVVTALSEAACRHGLVHRIIIMVDLGDLREGVWPDDLVPLVRDIMALPGIQIVGLGTNLSCYGGVVPSEDNMQQLVDYAEQLERTFGLHLQYISGGNSSALPLIAAGKMPGRVNHVRIGEAILLGRETIHRTAWPETFQDAFRLYAEVIERKEKPSIPIGEISEDAFGKKPCFADKGQRVRAILDIGREDVDVAGLQPLDVRLTILGASSDHLLVDITEAKTAIRIGDELAFSLNYSALLAAMTSPYVDKRSLHPRAAAAATIPQERVQPWPL
jgi:predicted amino acid racemase